MKPQTSITTGMPPALARATADHCHEYEDGGDLSVALFFSIRAEYEPADRSVGCSGGHMVWPTFLGAQIGDLVLGEADARKALGDAFIGDLTYSISDDLGEKMDRGEIAA